MKMQVNGKFVTVNSKIRFNEKWTPEPFSGCWLWTGSTWSAGSYGTMKYLGVNTPAHRVSYMLFKGDIPVGMEVLHSCDTPLCVNPDHLSCGTHAANMKDMVQKGRHWTPSGVNHSRAKLSTEQVRFIRANYPAIRPSKLGRMFGLDGGSIYRVAVGQTYKEVLP